MIIRLVDKRKVGHVGGDSLPHGRTSEIVTRHDISHVDRCGMAEGPPLAWSGHLSHDSYCGCSYAIA